MTKAANKPDLREVPKDSPHTMYIWDQVCETDPQYTKEVEFGNRKFHTIDAYYQIRKATELWGPYGHKWGLRDIHFDRMGESPMFMVSARFEYPVETDGEPGSANFEIRTAISCTTGRDSKPDSDFAKKAETDLITKSLSRLGFNTDVFLGQFDDNKYVSRMKERYSVQYTEEDFHTYLKLIEEQDGTGLAAFLSDKNNATQAALYSSYPYEHNKKGEMQRIINSLTTDGNAKLQEYAENLYYAAQNQDQTGVLENWEEMTDRVKAAVFNRLDPDTQNFIRWCRKQSKGAT